MRNLLLITVSCALLSACVNPNQTSQYGERRCGLLGCISSPYLKAKFDGSIIGQPVSTAIMKAGAPTSTYSNSGTDYLTWRREQRDSSFGLLACEEALVVRDSTVRDYRFQGHC